MRIAWKTKNLSVPRLARILSVLALVLAAGHLAEGVVARRAGTLSPTDIVLLSAGSTELSAGTLGQPEPLQARPALPALTDAPAPWPLAAPEAGACGTALALRPAAAAMMDVRLSAPCHAGERVVLRHAGLEVTGRLDEIGRLRMEVPALAEAARVEVTFADGQVAKASLVLPEARDQRRFGVQWQGGEVFALHGFEGGADFGQPGHVQASHRGLDEGGMLSALGDASVEAPLLAQIYTYPQAAMTVDLLVEAAVTPQTCGGLLTGQVMALEDGQATFTLLTLAMPDCSAVGEFLVLKNLAAEGKLAAN